MTSSLHGARQVAPAEHRRAPRDFVDFATRASGHSLTHDIRVVNISTMGLMGRTKAAISAGDALLFYLPHVRTVEATVRWAEDGRIGVEFITPITPDHYAMMLATMPKRENSW